MLRVDNVTMQFGGVFAVKNANIIINKGELVALIGPNGAGKTTLFNQVSGEYTPTSGKIFFDNGSGEKDITGMRPDLITRIGICRTFQNIRLFKKLSVFENVFIANNINFKSNLFSSVVRMPNYIKEEKENIKKTQYLLEKVGLSEFKEDRADSLPYGKQRRLEIARALATDPVLLLLDEPAAGMNPQETNELINFIQEIKDEYKLTIFMIEHHMNVVMNISDRIYVLDHGELIAEGTPKEIQSNSKVIEAYLGVDEDA
ncbi:MAG: ABC transporter ATP-binding protein [Tissierellia bacterium]|mgnify:CR=1 FL=1|nr:ABC transporter ATP-binding protein [Tissierellia bacterium]